MANGVYLDFERPIGELEEEIEDMESLAEKSGIDLTAELATLKAKLARLKEDIFSHLTPIQRVQLARHPRRPYPSTSSSAASPTGSSSTATGPMPTTTP